MHSERRGHGSKRSRFFILFALPALLVSIQMQGPSQPVRSKLYTKGFLGHMGCLDFSATYPSTGSPQELRYDASATVKLVPVRVIGPDGRPVRGLRKEDFILYDNGQQQVITEFEVHEPPGVSTLPESGARAAGILQEVNRKFFFVLDMQATDRVGNANAKAAVLAFASSHLQPGDEVCILTFGAFTGLVLRQYLTADMDKITRALKHSFEMGSTAGMPQAEVVELPRDDVNAQLSSMGGMPGLISGGQMGVVFRSVPEESQPSNRIVVPGFGAFGRSYADFDMSMHELARALAYIPGSKIVVYFSTRIPNKNVARLFADVNATIFAVNSNSVPVKGGGAGGGFMRRQKEEQGQALAEFAEASGGRYFDNVAAADDIARDVIELSGYYYVLGYYVHPKWDGRAHEINVETSVPGYRIMVQAGYNNPKPFAQWTDIEKQLQLFDIVLSDQPVGTESLDLPLEILCKPVATAANIAILTKLQVDEKIGLPSGQTEAYVFILDRNHQTAAAWRGVLDTATAKVRTLYPYAVTRLSPGPYECRVAFREMGTGRSAATRRTFNVPESPAANPGPRICAPPLLLQKGQGEFVRLTKSGKRSLVGGSLLSFYPLWPRGYVPLIDDYEGSEILALLSVVTFNRFDPEENLVIDLLDGPDGTPIPLVWRLADSKLSEDKTLSCLLRIGIGNQEHFRIKFTVFDASTGVQDSAIISY